MGSGGRSGGGRGGHLGRMGGLGGFWDELEDCEPWQDGTCVSINEVGNSSNYTADFDSNWEKPISRALNYMRVSASSRRPAWEGEQPKILESDPKAVAAVREQRIAAGMRGDGWLHLRVDGGCLFLPRYLRRLRHGVHRQRGLYNHRSI